MKSVTENSSILKPIMIGAGTVIIIFGMKMSASLLGPILLAIIIGFSVLPAAEWLIRKGVSTWLALLITIVFVLLGIVGLGTLIGISVNDLIATLPQYQQNFDGLLRDFQSVLSSTGVDINQLQSPLGQISSNSIVSLIGSFLGSIMGSLSGLVMMLLVLIFFILGAPFFAQKLKLDFTVNSPSLVRFRGVVGDLRQYVRITTWINFLVAAVNTVFLLVLGVDYAILWGALSFLTGYIPNIGFWIALIPPFLLALVQFGALRALIVLVGYIVINGGVQNFLQPKMMGAGLNLSAFVVTISLFFLGWVLGPMGALLAVPMTMILKEVYLDAYDDTRALADLMSADASPGKNAPDVPAN